MSIGKVLVVGGGIVGSRRRGVSSNVVSTSSYSSKGRSPIQWSSFDEHRILRHTYGTLTGYAALMPAAFACCRLLDLPEQEIRPSRKLSPQATR